MQRMLDALNPPTYRVYAGTFTPKEGLCRPEKMPGSRMFTSALFTAGQNKQPDLFR